MFRFYQYQKCAHSSGKLRKYHRSTLTHFTYIMSKNLFCIWIINLIWSGFYCQITIRLILVNKAGLNWCWLNCPIWVFFHKLSTILCQLYFGSVILKLTRPMKSSTLKCNNPLYQMTSNFTFINVLSCKLWKKLNAIIANFVCFG